MHRYPPSTIYRYLDLPSTQRIQTRTSHRHNTTPPLPTLVQAPPPTPYLHHPQHCNTNPRSTRPLFTQDWLLLYAFRDLWKEWGYSNFQIFSQNSQFPHRPLESLEHFNVFFNIYNSEHYGFIFFYKYTLHVCYVFNVISRIILMTDRLNSN